ncbi:MAG: anti-sigma factor antagonist [Gemmatimonadetes bacterium]|nr:MAG: anti-sigma factor antagonist [Gemmatimonadota bacterium]
MADFEIKTREDGPATSIIYVKGFLDAHTAPRFEEALQKSIDSQRYHILVNFQDLNYISSAGLGVLMGFIEEVREAGGDIVLANLTPRVFKVFDLLGFTNLYRIFDNETEALEALNSK